MKEETTPTAGLQVEDIKRVTPLIRALYLGQKVYEGVSFNPIELKSHFLNDSPYISCWLSLRPLSSITDDESVKVAKIVEPNEFLKGWWMPVHGKRWANQTIEFIAVPNGYLVYQYLLHQSYALPYYDSVTNTTITVDMQVAAGIIKLKS